MNKEILNKNYPNIYQEIIKMIPNKNIYKLIQTKTNKPTLKINLKGGVIFLHSKYNPKREALSIAEENYNKNIENYIVFGLGCGYHVEELIRLAPDSNFYILEMNKDIFKIALENVDLNNIIDNKKVELYLSDDIEEIGKILKDLIELDNIKPVVHNASLSAMPKKLENIKHLLEEFKLKEGSINQFSNMLHENFNENIKNFDENVDTLFGRFNNIPLYLISAGPSLDKNINELTKMGDNGIILVVGRAVKALAKSNIKPDFVVVTDPKPTIYRGQLRGVDIDAPVIALSTCDKNVMENYKGKKLIALQNGYELAEKYASKHKNSLVDTGGSVATTALDIAIKMGCNPIVFVGQDLAFTDQKTHTSFTSSKDINHLKNLREVEGINSNIVYTSKNLSIYLRWIQNRIAKEKNIDFIDATEGGAKIKGTQILTLKETIEKH